ncbi:MAG: carbohydrate ABC transporter permease [Spirochaetaceae bacterium]|nr:MAG: carbohydrate ABC transporter permease [Spirochaetaceae bacterium]
MIAVIFVTLFPFWYAVVGSFNHGADYMRGGVTFWPRRFTTANYQVVLRERQIVDAYRITILRTAIGTTAHIVFTGVFAYGFSRPYLRGRKAYATIGLITLFFSGGLIPIYLLYRSLGLLNNFLVYVVPGMFNFWNVLIFQTFFREIPISINESAKMDGANEYTIFFRLIMPVSKPVFAAIALFVAVWHWNSFFDAMVFTTSRSLQPLQLYLMRIIRTREAAANVASRAAEMMATQFEVNSTTIQLATIVVTALPIILLYPFLQKYFVKGLLIGSIKG